jgi:predicted TIM-barrel fold metal-dependent hydrolase
MVEDWTAGIAKGRLIPLCMVPLWDPRLAADEVRRNAARGCFAVTFSENPEPLGLPSLYADRFWDPFFAACQETDTTVCMHIGSSSRMPTTTSDAPFIIGSALDWQNAMGSMLDYVFSGTLERFPTLKIAYSEGQVGWMPYILERADKKWEEFHGEEFGNVLPNPPSTYLEGRVFGCVFDDDTGLRNRDVIGMDRICYETDYPHAQATWPNTKAIASAMCERAGLDDDEVYALMRGNAIRAFGLDRFGIAV